MAEDHAPIDGFAFGDLYGQQTKDEFDWWCEIIRGSKSILEIGSCYGHTLRLMAEVCPGAMLRSIDWCGGGGAWQGQLLRPGLDRTMENLRSRGHDAQLFEGQSQSPEAIAWAQQWAPYDAIFIDADHALTSVSADWLNYGHMGKVVGFHDINDIVNPGRDEVKLFWQDFKASTSLKHDEKAIGGQGIGVVWT